VTIGRILKPELKSNSVILKPVLKDLVSVFHSYGCNE